LDAEQLLHVWRGMDQRVIDSAMTSGIDVCKYVCVWQIVTNEQLYIVSINIRSVV